MSDIVKKQAKERLMQEASAEYRILLKQFEEHLKI
jgi:hypothetical protein